MIIIIAIRKNTSDNVMCQALCSAHLGLKLRNRDHVISTAMRSNKFFVTLAMCTQCSKYFKGYWRVWGKNSTDIMSPCLKLSKNVLKLKLSPLCSPQGPTTPAPSPLFPYPSLSPPHSLCSSHTGLLAFPPAHQALSCPRTSAQALPSAWNTLRPHGAWLTPSTPSTFSVHPI